MHVHRREVEAARPLSPSGYRQQDEFDDRLQETIEAVVSQAGFAKPHDYRCGVVKTLAGLTIG